MDNIKLGSIITTNQQKDAVHIAIVPVMADQALFPGEHIGLVYPGVSHLTSRVHNNIGIVDPFLKDVVLPGQRFWMFMYPGSISSLRHDWTHDAFDAVVAPNKIDPDYNDYGDSFDCSICDDRPDIPEYESAAKYSVSCNDTEVRRESIESMTRLAVDFGLSYGELMITTANFVQYLDESYVLELRRRTVQKFRDEMVGHLGSAFWTLYDNITGTITPEESKNAFLYSFR